MWREYLKVGLALGLGYRLASMDSADVRALVRIGGRLYKKAKTLFTPPYVKSGEPYEDECPSMSDAGQCEKHLGHAGQHTSGTHHWRSAP